MKSVGLVHWVRIQIPLLHVYLHFTELSSSKMEGLIRHDNG